jgi:hypothetical protein
MQTAIRYVLCMGKDQLPSEPSTVRPAQSAPTSVEPLSRKGRYGQRLLIVSIIAYAFPLFMVALPIFFSIVINSGLEALIYIISFGTTLIFLLNVCTLAFEVILLIMSIRYLIKGRLAGKARMAAIVSLVIYSLLTAALLALEYGGGWKAISSSYFGGVFYWLGS